ncbi:MAG: helix-turn-helix transcriptional regulator [Clostridia bacterium]|nr:helix-turn-helix transcriptional regulator [Clostridia bacterium]
MLKLQEIREEKNILQKELAEKLQKTRACISSWETNKTEPDLQSLIGLADILEVTTDYLLGRTNDVGLIEVHNQLTQDQQELLSLYNRMSFQDKNQLIGFAKALVY